MNTWYDIYDDWDLIEASFAMQYPTKDLYSDDMDWKEFTILLNGIMPETPLGNIIQIRAETNEEIIKNFSENERRIHNEWREKQLKLKYMNKSKEEVMKDISNMFRSMFS